MRLHHKVFRDDLSQRLLTFFTHDQYTPSRRMRTSGTFKKFPIRKVQARAQILRDAGLLEKKGVRSGLMYKLTPQGLELREQIRKNGHRKP